MTKPIQPEPTQDGREIPRLLSLTVAPIVVEQRERGVAKKKKKERESVKKRKEKKERRGGKKRKASSGAGNNEAAWFVLAPRRATLRIMPGSLLFICSACIHVSSVCLIFLDAHTYTHTHIYRKRGRYIADRYPWNRWSWTRNESEKKERERKRYSCVRRTTRARVAPVVITQPGARNRDTPRSSHAHQPAFDVTGGPASASATT